MVGKIVLLFFTISWIINHFGANLVKGGRSPSDKRVIIMMVVKVGEVFQVWLRVDVVILLYMRNIENMEAVRKM